MPQLFVKGVEGKGRCVFAGEKILKGIVIDTNFAIVFPSRHLRDVHAPLVNYPFQWDEDHSCIALGIVSLANHARDNPTAVTQRDYKNFRIRLVAIRDIEAGEEITYDYKVPLWFEPEPPAKLNLKEIENGTSSK